MCRINCLFTILSTLGLNIKASQLVHSVTQLCPTLRNSMDCSMPGLPVHHQLPELAQTHVHQVGDAIQPSHPLCFPFSSYLQSFSASGSFPMSWLLALGGQSIGVSASASDLPMNIHDWFPLELTGLIYLQSKRLQSLLQHHSSKAKILQYKNQFIFKINFKILNIKVNRWNAIEVLQLMFI